MKVILTQDVKKLGKKGEIKDVSDGYAKNFLLPKKLVEIADKRNIARVEQVFNQKEKEKEMQKKEIMKLIQAVKTKKIIIKVKAKNRKLFGSIGAKEIAAALKENKLETEWQNIKLEKSIKETGYHNVELDFGNGLKEEFKIEVLED